MYTPGVPYLITRRRPHQARQRPASGYATSVVAINRVVFITHFPCFVEGVNPLLCIPQLGFARVGIVCLQLMTAREDLNLKASINESQASLARQVPISSP